MKVFNCLKKKIKHACICTLWFIARLLYTIEKKELHENCGSEYIKQINKY